MKRFTYSKPWQIPSKACFDVNFFPMQLTGICVCMYSAEVMLNLDYQHLLKRAYESSEDDKIHSSIIRTMERINKVPGGSNKLVESGAIECVMASLNRPASQGNEEQEKERSGMVECSIRMLDRICRHKEHAEYIEENYNGLSVISDSLETYSSNEKVVKAGSRVLSKLASSDIPGLVEKMKRSENKKEKEFLSGLLSNLAIEEENVDSIIQGGGYDTFLSGLQSDNTKTMSSSSRALSRIADASEENIDSLIAEGATQNLVDVMVRKQEDAESIRAAIPVLSKFASKSRCVSHLEDIGAIRSVIDALKSHASDEAVAESSLSFMDHLVTSQYDASRLVAAGTIESTLDAMKENENSDSVQANGLRNLIYMAYNEENLAQMVDKGAIDTTLKALERSKKKEVVQAGMYFLTSLSLIPDYKKLTRDNNGIDKVLDSLENFTEEGAITETASELMAELADSDSVQAVVNGAIKSVNKLLESPSEEHSKIASSALTKMSSFSIVPEFADQIVSSNELKTLVENVKKVSTKHSLPQHEELLVTCSKALSNLVKYLKTEDHIRYLEDSGGISVMISSLKNNPRNVPHAKNCIQFLEKVADSEARINLLIKKGAIEACGAALRANRDDTTVVQRAADTLLRLCRTDEGAVAVAKHGATRQVITVLSSNRETPNFSSSFQKCMALLDRISLTSEGVGLLIKQGCVDAVTETMASISSNERIASYGTSLLSKLLTRDDVLSALETLESYVDTVDAKARSKEGISELCSVISRIGHFAKVSTYGKEILQENGGKTLSTITNKFMEVAKDSSRRIFAPVAVNALARLSACGEFPEQTEVMKHIITSLKNDMAVLESMEFISQVAKRSSSSASTTLSDASLLDSLVHQLENQKESHLLKSCFDTLAALASYPETVETVASSKVKQLVIDWIDDNWEDAPVDALVSSLNVISTLARSASCAHDLLQVGTGNLLKSILANYCLDAEETHTNILQAVACVMCNLAQNDLENLRKLHEDGAVRRLLKAVSANGNYVHDPGCMEVVLKIISRAYELEELSAILEDIDAPNIIMTAMDNNSTYTAVVNAGTQALQATGASAEVGTQYAAEVNNWAEAVENSEAVSEDMIAGLGKSVQKMGNYLLVDGVVTSQNASNVTSILLKSVKLLCDSPSCDAQMICSGLTSISRVVIDASGSDKAAAVRLIVDTLKRYSENPKVRETCIHCLSMLSKDAGALRAINELDALDLITDLAKRNPGDQKLNEAVSKTVDNVTEETESRASEMVSEESDSNVKGLSSVLRANAADPGKLQNIVSRVSSAKGGETVLWSVLASQNMEGSANTDMYGEIIESLASKVTTSESAIPEVATPSQVSGIAKCLNIAVRTQKALTAESDTRSKAQVVRLTESTLTVMAAIKLDDSGCLLLATENGIGSAIELVNVNISDPETVKKVLKVIEAVTAHCTRETCSPVATLGNMNTLSQTLQLYRDGAETEDERIDPDAAIVKSCASIIRNTAVTMGSESNINRNIVRIIAKCGEVFSGDSDFHKLYEEITEAAADLFSDEQAEEMQKRLKTASKPVAAVAKFESVYDENQGAFYYVNKETGESAWDEPEEFKEMKKSLTAVAEASTINNEDSVQQVETEALTGMITIMNNNPKQAEIVEAAAKSLNTLAMNAANCTEIAKSGGIKAIIDAINNNPDNKSLLRILLALFERVSRNDAFKEQIAESGGIPIITQTGLQRHLEDEDVVKKCLSVLANLAFNSSTNISRIMESEGVTAAEMAMQQYPDHPRILENATCALSNLMYGSEENKLIVGQTCGDEITHVIRVHFRDVNLYKMALRAIGNLSYVDANIRYIADKHKATEVIVNGMDEHSEDEEAIQLAMEVLGNFASIEEDVETMQKPDYQSIPSLMYEHGGTAAILKYMNQYFQNSSILKSGLNALCNVANDMETAKKAALEQGMVTLVIDILQQHDWDEEIVAHCLPLVATLTYSDECLGLIVEMNGIQTLLSTIEAHGKNEDVLTAGQLALTNLAANEQAQKNMKDLDGVSTILLLLTNHRNSKDFCSECFATLTRLAADDELSKIIAENGLHTLMQILELYHDDAEFLTGGFRLLGHLAFVESNIKILVQYNGIQVIIGAISAHPKSRGLMVRSIQTLDNIAMASKENAQVVVDEGGKELIETIMEAYSDDEEIQRYGSSALLSISSLENLNRAQKEEEKPKATKKKTTTREEDPLCEYRHLLRAGQIMDVWKKGTPKRAHVLVSSDFRSIIWQDPRSKNKLGALDVRSISQVKQGKGPNHKKKLLSRREPDPSRCFSVQGEKFSLDAETSEKTDVPKWVDAFQQLYEVSKTQPDKL